MIKRIIIPTVIGVGIVLILVFVMHPFRAKEHVVAPGSNARYELVEETIAGKHSVRPSAGYVPEEETAIRIAEAVWIPIYGRKVIEGEKPFKASLENGVWTVTGTLPRSEKGLPVVGGTAIAEISKESGAVLRVSHGK